MARSAIIDMTEALVMARYTEKLPAWARYHTLEHTREVVAGCVEIGTGMSLTGEEMEIIILAAWFHDIGYLDGAEEHEARGVRIAEDFLHEQRYPEARIPLVTGCIAATKVPQRPTTVLEQIVCDADLMYIGGPRFRERSDALREEWQLRMGVRFGDVEWLQKNIEFVGSCEFHTGFVRRTYGGMRGRNLSQLYERLDNAGSLPG
jgi:predicted metal-dependent HD superfamily phosphohydrolase